MSTYTQIFDVTIDECRITNLMNTKHIEDLEKLVYEKLDNQHFEIESNNPSDSPQNYISTILNELLNNKVKEDYLNVYIKYTYDNYEFIDSENNDSLTNSSKMSFEYSNK